MAAHPTTATTTCLREGKEAQRPAATARYLALDLRRRCLARVHAHAGPRETTLATLALLHPGIVAAVGRGFCVGLGGGARWQCIPSWGKGGGGRFASSASLAPPSNGMPAAAGCGSLSARDQPALGQVLVRLLPVVLGVEGAAGVHSGIVKHASCSDQRCNVGSSGDGRAAPTLSLPVEGQPEHGSRRNCVAPNLNISLEVNGGAVGADRLETHGLLHQFVVEGAGPRSSSSVLSSQGMDTRHQLGSYQAAGGGHGAQKGGQQLSPCWRR